MLSDAESLSVLKHCTHGVLALSDQEGFPYAVPMSYVYFNNAIYFHCAMTGHKMDLLGANPHASFCVVDRDIIMPETFTTHFRSVIAFGNISCITDRMEKERILYILGEKYPRTGRIPEKRNRWQHYAYQHPEAANPSHDRKRGNRVNPE